MSKFDDCMATYKEQLNELKISFNEELLTKVAKGCGPSIYNVDASKVSSSDEKELETVKKNFLIKKLGLADDAKLDEAIAKVVDQLGKSNRNKYRAIFYYLLVEEFGKAAVYN